MKQFLLLFLLSFFLVGLSCSDGSLSLAQLQANAERGDAKAQAELGYRYYLGNGVSKNYTEAFKWVKLAADQNNAEGQYLLGYMYHEGHGVTRDYNEAFRLTKLAAEQGLGEAQVNLGFLHYYYGRGVAKDAVRAYMWVSLATENLSPRNATSSEVKKTISSAKALIILDMTLTQIADADRVAQECRDKNYKNC